MGRTLGSKHLSSARRRRATGIGAVITLAMLVVGTLVVPAIAAAEDAPPADVPTQVTEPSAPPEQPAAESPEAEEPAAESPAPEAPETESPPVDEAEEAPAVEQTQQLSVATFDVQPQAAPTCTGGPSTWNCSVNPGNIPASNPGFGNGNDCASVYGQLVVPPAPNDWGWHFVAPANSNFISLTATFTGAGTIGPIAPVAGVNSHPDASHLYLFTGVNDTLTAATAVIQTNSSKDPGKFVLSHVCPGTTGTDPGSLTVSKSVVGSPGGATFTIEVDCDDGSSHDATLTFSSTGALTGGALPITGIPAGTECTVEETGDGNADDISYSPGGANPPTVTIGSNQQAAVAVTNTYNSADPGSLTVEKSVDGDAGAATFTIEVDCDDGDDHDATLTFDGTGALTGGALPITGIPADAKCTVEETGDGNADDVSYTPGGPNPPTVNIVSNQEKSVTVTNTFDAPPSGSLTVEKSVDGDAGAATFTIEVDCDDGDDHDATLTFDGTGALTGGALPITGIPADAKCTVEETGDGDADSVSYTPGGPNPPTVNIVANQEKSVTVTNTFAEIGGNILVTLNVDKEVVGSANPADGTEFGVHVVCTGAANVDTTLTFTYPSGLGVQQPVDGVQIPGDGEVECTVTETDTGGVLLLGYKVDGGAIQSGASVVLNAGTPNRSVTVVNDPTGVIVVGGASVTADGGQLPNTGSDSSVLVYVAVALLGMGGALLFVVRRRRRPSFTA